MSEKDSVEEELTEEQKAHIAVLRRKFFRGVSIFSVFGTIILLIVLRFTSFNYKNVEDYDQYVDHKDKFMRFNAAKALGNFKNNPKATTTLVKMLGDEAKEVRWHAAASLSKLRDPISVSSLIQAVNSEKDISAKSIDIYALGQIADDRSVELLKNLFYNPDKKLNVDDNKVMVFSVIQAIASYNKDTTNKILTDFEKSKDTSNELKQFSIKMRAAKGIAEQQ